MRPSMSSGCQFVAHKPHEDPFLNRRQQHWKLNSIHCLMEGLTEASCIDARHETKLCWMKGDCIEMSWNVESIFFYNAKVGCSLGNKTWHIDLAFCVRFLVKCNNY